MRRGDTERSVRGRGRYSMLVTEAVFHLAISPLKVDDPLNKDLGDGMSRVGEVLSG